MAFTEMYMDAANGSQLNSGTTTSGTATYTTTNGNWSTATNVFTPTDGSTPASSISVGDIVSIYLDAATIGVYLVRVTAVAAGVNGGITCSATVKAGTAPTTGATGRSLKMGGCLKGPNGTDGWPLTVSYTALQNTSGDMVCWNMKNNASYAITAQLNLVLFAGALVSGYSSTVRDGGKAVFDGGTSGASYALWQVTGGKFADFVFQNNGATGSNTMLVVSGRVEFFRCVFTGSRGFGCTSSSTPSFFNECEFYGNNLSNTSNTGGASVGSSLHSRCVFHSNAGSNSIGAVCVASNATPAFDGCWFGANGNAGLRFAPNSGLGTLAVRNCNFYGNATDGIVAVASGAVTACLIENSHFVSNGTGGTGYGVSQPAAPNNPARIVNCAFYNNATGQTNNANSDLVSGSVTLTGDPFNNAATGDFSLNSTSGAGADARAAGRQAWTQTAAGYTTPTPAGYPDIGVHQHQDTSGATGPVAQRIMATNIGTY